MRLTDRVKEIIELNLADYHIAFVVGGAANRVFPMYYARLIGDDVLAFPVTGATGIDKALELSNEAALLVADRHAGYEAYVLEGRARYVTNSEDMELVQSVRNLVPGFPIHGAVVFEIENVRLAPPP